MKSNQTVYLCDHCHKESVQVLESMGSRPPRYWELKLTNGEGFSKHFCSLECLATHYEAHTKESGET